jgi:hypothetical protein
VDRSPLGFTPLDFAATGGGSDEWLFNNDKFQPAARLLLEHGAELSPLSAAALGRWDSLGKLSKQELEGKGVLEAASRANPNCLSLIGPGQHLIEEFDYSAHRLPLGYTRGINSPMPVEIVQRNDRIVLLYEMNNTFHMVFTTRATIPKTWSRWFGHSIGKWEGDTLMVDTVGFNDKTRVDTEGHPHKEALHVVEHFRRSYATHITYDVTITDPGAYTRPWKNVRTFTLRPDWEIMEYNCQRNIKTSTKVTLNRVGPYPGLF